MRDCARTKSSRSYVAAYFAISGALQAQQAQIDESKRLAVWVLDVTRKAHLPKLEVIKVPGGNSTNVAAQAGMFTLLRQEGGRGKPFTGETALDRLPPPMRVASSTVTAAPA
jgi:glutamine amidotransferase PdxT